VTAIARVSRGTGARAMRASSIVALPRSAAVTVSSEKAPSRWPAGPRKRAVTSARSSLNRKPPSSAESRTVTPARASISGAQLETSTTWVALAAPDGPAAKNASPAPSAAAASSEGKATRPTTVP
jgi:hypothetical protein